MFANQSDNVREVTGRSVQRDEGAIKITMRDNDRDRTRDRSRKC